MNRNMEMQVRGQRALARTGSLPSADRQPAQQHHGSRQDRDDRFAHRTRNRRFSIRRCATRLRARAPPTPISAWRLRISTASNRSTIAFACRQRLPVAPVRRSARPTSGARAWLRAMAAQGIRRFCFPTRFSRPPRPSWRRSGTNWTSKRWVVGAKEDRLGTITASFGLARLAPGETAEMFVARADSKLFEAKTAGRNRVVVETNSEPGASAGARAKVALH